MLRRIAVSSYSTTIAVLLAGGIAGGIAGRALIGDDVRAALAAVVLVAAVVLARRTIRIAMITLVSAGLVVAAASGLPWGTVARSLGTWTQITVLIATVPIVSSVLIRRRYVQLVIAGAARVGALATQVAVLVSGHVIGSVALLAVVPVLGDFLGLRDQSETVRRRFSQLILRGFAASVTWSPSTGAMGVIVLATGLRWTELAPSLMVIGATGVLLGILWTVVAHRRSDTPVELTAAALQLDADRTTDRGRLLELLAFLVVTFGAILVLELNDFATTVVIVPLVMVTTTLLLTVVTEGPEALRETVREHLRERMPRGAGEASFLLAAGFLGSVLAASGISEATVERILTVASGSGVPVAVILPLLVISVTVLGVPPLVAVALVSGALPIAITGLSATLYAGLLVIGSATSLLIAPLTPTMLIVADYAGTSPAGSGVAANRLFAPTFVVVLVLVALLLG